MNLKTINAIFAIAYRDFIKLLRDKRRVIASLIFPFIFIGVLGNSLDANLGKTVEYSFIAFTFTGVLAQVLFQSSASGLISLVIDREEDFAQEMFIAPVSRYVIVIGKILGEALVSMVQGLGVVLFGAIMGVEFSFSQILALIPIFLVATMFGGAFGVLVMSNLNDQKAANLIFPFVLFPQIFLAGVFTPIATLPAGLLILSRLAPLTYVVDLTRHLFFWNSPELSLVTINSFWVNVVVVSVLFVIFLLAGTYIFVRNERNK